MNFGTHLFAQQNKPETGIVDYRIRLTEGILLLFVYYIMPILILLAYFTDTFTQRTQIRSRIAKWTSRYTQDAITCLLYDAYLL